jgi:hypothetical protein
VKTKTVSRTLSILSLLALPACAQFLGQEKLSAPEEIQMSKMNVNLYPVTKTVCDPMGGDNDPRSNAGLKADLYWLPSGANAATSASDLISRGTKSSQNLFFTQLNVPTRLFNTGFTSDSGAPVKNDSGDTLIENFAMRFSSVLRLAPSQDEGLYELAVLSDDGTVLRLRDDDGVYKPVVDSDGDHPTRMGCSTQAISMTHETEKMLQLDYYQGPRYHIALVVMMRKLDAGQQPGKDALCGMTSNEAWFDYNHGSAPQKAYNDLLARGWQVLTADNYAIPNSAFFNPCKEGEIPEIANVKLGETFVDAVTLDWDTDIMATSQIVVTNVKTGAQIISTSDNVMSLHHHVRLVGLEADTDYSVQAVSISDTYGKGLSEPIAYHTAQ